MTLEYERQEMRALSLLPIRQLSAYSADYTVACRVGKAIIAHRGYPPWNQFMQQSLEITLSEP